MLSFGFATNALIVESILLRLGTGDPITAGGSAMGFKFKDLVEAKTNGAVKIGIFPNVALGDELEMFQNARRGTLDLAYIVDAEKHIIH